MVTIQSQNFGVEIEMTGVSRGTAASVIANYFGVGGIHFAGGTYQTYEAKDSKGRVYVHRGDIPLHGLTPVRAYDFHKLLEGEE